MGDFNDTIVRDTAHRPWPMPRRPWVMRQTWSDLLFAHWPIDARDLRPKVPAAFELDLFDGDAWISVVPFRMTNVGPRGVPTLPGVSEFPELNVRTYVRVGDRAGVFFFSLDAASSVAVWVARTLLNLPYYHASMSMKVRGERGQATASDSRVISYESVRRTTPLADFNASYGPVGEASLARPRSLDYFLTERYCLYHTDRRGRPYRMEVHHPPWQLQSAHAELRHNTMVEVCGVSVPARMPLLHFARRQDVVAWAPVTI